MLQQTDTIGRSDDVELNRSRQAVRELMDELVTAIEAGRRSDRIRDLMISFISEAHRHLVRERHISDTARAHSDWWRYAYLVWVLGQIEALTRTNPVNGIEAKRLLDMWAFEQHRNSPFNTFDKPARVTLARSSPRRFAG